MQKSWKLQILVTFLFITISLIGCSTSDAPSKEVNKVDGLCQSNPFDAGVELTLPITPLSILIDSNGVDFKLESKFSVDLFVFRLEPYVLFDTPSNPVSSCLKVEIHNPEWEGGYRRFYVNFSRDNIFRVRVKTDEFTEFVFSKERWIANPPGEKEFVRYEYGTNTLYLDASNGRITEFDILAEKPEIREKYNFCVNELQNRRYGYFIDPTSYVVAYFQDFVNSTRDTIFGQFGPLGGGVFIPIAWLIGGLWLLNPLVKLKDKVSGNWVFGRFIVLIFWTFFWIVVYNAIPLCLG